VVNEAVIDFRVQPPYGSFLGIHFFRPRAASPDPVTATPFVKGRRSTPSFEGASMELFIDEMDAAGISSAVIMGQRAASEWGSVANEDIVHLVRTYPGRFHGFAGIDPTDADAAEQATRALDDGCIGLALIPGWSDPPVRNDSPLLWPLLEICQARGALVMITISHYIGPDMSWAEPSIVQRTISAFPDITFIIGHACWPWTLAACALAMRNTNVYLMPEFYMYIPGIPGARDYVEAANGFLSHRILYSSCYPSRSLGQAIEEFDGLGIGAEQRTLITSGNAKRLLGRAAT
jgi:predicted TIM-barrel fold metal-dependent hydrolase